MIISIGKSPFLIDTRLGRLYNSLLNDMNLIVMCILYDHNNYVINSPTH